VFKIRSTGFAPPFSHPLFAFSQVGKKCVYAFSTSPTPNGDDAVDLDTIEIDLRYLSFTFHDVNDRY
jgi:hypothetical protein